MNESEYLSIPECYMKEIPKKVWYSWPIEIRKDFFRMISDPNFFFYNSRPFNQEIYDENIEPSDYEKKEFWKRIDYFFLNLGITNLNNLNDLWGYFAIPFKHRTGKFLKYFFYLPENKKRLNSTLSYYSISSNSIQSSIVKMHLIQKEAQDFILFFIRDYININSTAQTPHIANFQSNNSNYTDQISQGFISNYNIVNESLINPKMKINEANGHLTIPENKDTSTYGINIPYTNSFYDSNQQNITKQDEIQKLEKETDQNQTLLTSEEQNIIGTERRGRGRPRKYPIQNLPSVKIPKKRGRKKKSIEQETKYIDQDQDSENLPSSDEKNETDTVSYEDNSNISDYIENKPQSDIKNHKSEEIPNSKNNDEEIKDSDISLKDFIASDESYDYITEDQDDDDDDDDGEYQEITTKFRNYHSTKAKKKRKPKRQLNHSKLESVKQMNQKKLTKDRKNFINQQSYNQYSNSSFNPYNNESSFNQLYNNGRYSNLSIINANATAQNQQQQLYKFNNNTQFIQEEVKFGIHPPVNPPQIGYQQVFHITPQPIPNNQFSAIQAANEIKITPLAPVNQPNISILQGPVQPLITTQVRPIQPANIPINNYPNIIVNGNLSSTFSHLEKGNQLISSNIDQPPTVPIKPHQDLSFQLQPNKNANQYYAPKLNDNTLIKDIILVPKRVPEPNISNSNSTFNSNTKSIIPNSGNNYQLHYPNYNNNNYTYLQKQPATNNHPIPIQSQTQVQQKSLKQSHNYQSQQPLKNASKKQISKQHDYDDEYEYENNQYDSYSVANKTDDENYSSNDEGSSKNSNFSAPPQTSESAIESEHQNLAEAGSENSDYFDKNIKKENKIKESNQADVDSKIQNAKFMLRKRKKLAKDNQYSSDENEYENDEITGIISHLSYLYDESSSKNEYSRISKIKPSDLIDLEFAEH